jgi:hypothetical protein
MFMMMIMVCAALVAHIYLFPDEADRMTQPTDAKLGIYIVVNLCASLVGALAYGKPFSPFLISICGLFVSVGVAKFHPDLLDWMENFLPLLLCCYYYVNIGINITPL